MRNMIITVFAALISVSAVAESNIKYSCTLNGAERVIEVVYTTPGEKLPCEVHYTKDGQSQTLWTYSNESDKCEAQAASFAEKQASWGWQCSNDAARNVAAE